jgi:hypothetical protein
MITGGIVLLGVPGLDGSGPHPLPLPSPVRPVVQRRRSPWDRERPTVTSSSSDALPSDIRYQSWIRAGWKQRKGDEGGAIPYQDPAFLNGLGAHDVVTRCRQYRSFAEYVSRCEPKEKRPLALCRNKEISGTAFGKQEQALGRISLVNDHGTGRIVPLCRGASRTSMSGGAKPSNSGALMSEPTAAIRVERCWAISVFVLFGNLSMLTQCGKSTARPWACSAPENYCPQ